MFTLAISCLTTSNLPWFMDLIFQVPMQYFSLQHQTLLLPPDNWVSFPSLFILSGPISLLFPSNTLDTFWPGGLIFQCHLFTFSYCSWGSQGKNTGVLCHSLLQSTTFCQNSPLWPIYLGWTCMAWLIASLRYTSLFTTARQSSIKWVLSCSVVPNYLWSHGW